MQQAWVRQRFYCLLVEPRRLEDIRPGSRIFPSWSPSDFRMTVSPSSNPRRLVALCWLATISSNPLLPTRNAQSPLGIAAKVLTHKSLFPFCKCKYKFFTGYLLAAASDGRTEIQGVNKSDS